MEQATFLRKIPEDMRPWECNVNGVKYVYPAGTEQNVPAEVAALIDAYWEKQEVDYPETGISFNDLRDRPFGESTEVLFDQRVEFAGEEEAGWQMNEILPISAGDSVAITFDGVVYKNVAIDFNGMVSFGNDVLAGNENGNAIPVIAITGNMSDVSPFTTFIGEPGYHTIKIEKSVIHTIDPKFLPEMSSYCHVNIWYDENDGGYKSDKTYDDIKAAEAKKTPVIGTLTVPSGNVYTLVGCDLAAPSAYLVAFDLYSMPDTLKVFYVWITESNSVFVMASNFSGTKTDV